MVTTNLNKRREIIKGAEKEKIPHKLHAFVTEQGTPSKPSALRPAGAASPVARAPYLPV